MNPLWLALGLFITTPQDSLPAAPPPVFTVRLAAVGVSQAPLVPPRQQPPDEWFATDKLQHFTISYGVTAFAFAGAQLAGAEGDSRLRFAVGAGILAGVAKEIADTQQGRHFSLKDLLYDVLGVAAAVAILRNVR